MVRDVGSPQHKSERMSTEAPLPQGNEHSNVPPEDRAMVEHYTSALASLWE